MYGEVFQSVGLSESKGILQVECTLFLMEKMGLIRFVMQKQWFQYASLAQRESDDTGSTGRFSYVMCPSAEQFSSVQWSFFLYKQQ